MVLLHVRVGLGYSLETRWRTQQGWFVQNFLSQIPLYLSNFQYQIYCDKPVILKLYTGPIGIMAKEISGLKREVKRAKLFEIQRHVRRIRQLANKKGTEAQLKKNQRKIERFEKELEFLKDTEVTEIVRRITNKEGDEDGHQEIEISRENIDLQKRALDRIINSTKLKKFLEKVSTGEEDSAQAEHRSSHAEAASKKKQRKNPKQKTGKAKSFASVKPRQKEEEEDDDGDDTGSDEELPRQQKATKENAMINKNLTSGKNPELEELEDDNSYLPCSDFSESDVEEDSDDISSSGLKPKGLESCFVQTMSGQKKDALNAKSKQGKEKGKADNKKEKKNRKGQRARQQMWEKVHGKSAKHLHKKKTELKSKESKEPKQQKNVKTQHSLKKKAGDDETLHPSWEATKRRRLQETLKVEFKGEKIRFDDSE